MSIPTAMRMQRKNIFTVMERMYHTGTCTAMEENPDMNMVMSIITAVCMISNILSGIILPFPRR